MSTLPHVLLVEDTLSLARLYQQYLNRQPIRLSHAECGAAAKLVIAQSPPELVLLDLRLPDMDGMEILQWVRDEKFPTAVVVITAHGSVDIAVETMRLGADDFLEKPFDGNRLRTTVSNLLERARLRQLLYRIEETFERTGYHGFIGASLAMQGVYRIIDAAAPSKATVFITGESGTGKEVCAEAIHQQGARKKGPFIALNCGAIPKDLMESEIFGHVKGAFTGASSERVGAAGQADGGTLFLDEIGEMSLELQIKLLRFIQTGSFQKVGGSKLEKVDIRLICATNRDPQEEVAAGRFREDLYYRLHVIPIEIPPLRERDDDVLLIAQSFLDTYSREEGKTFSGFAAPTERILRQYPWPGNVRQLQNVIRNIVVLHDGDQVQPEQLPPPLDKWSTPEKTAPTGQNTKSEQPDKPTPATIAERIVPLAQVEREAIERAIDFCDGNIPKAAALLEVSPSTIYRKKQAWN